MKSVKMLGLFIWLVISVAVIILLVFGLVEWKSNYLILFILLYAATALLNAVLILLLRKGGSTNFFETSELIFGASIVLAPLISVILCIRVILLLIQYCIDKD